MSENIDDQRLEDYVDGLLTQSEAARVERWLAASAAGRATVEFLRSLRQEAAALPTELQPRRDLWPEIQGRMAPLPLAPVADSAPPPGAVWRPLWWPRLQPVQWTALAAAAMFLVVSSSALTAWIVGAWAPPPGTPATGPVTTGVVLADSLPLEARYGLEIEQLLWALYEHRDALDPDTVSTLETNLRVINRAIHAAREALAEDPGNDGLNRLLDSNYRRKLELLQRANRIIEMS